MDLWGHVPHWGPDSKAAGGERGSRHSGEAQGLPEEIGSGGLRGPKQAGRLGRGVMVGQSLGGREQIGRCQSSPFYCVTLPSPVLRFWGTGKTREQFLLGLLTFELGDNLGHR